MTEQNDQVVVDETDATDVPADELTVLKERADRMGLKYHPNIGVEALRAKVAAAQAEPPAAPEVLAPEAPAAPMAAPTVSFATPAAIDPVLAHKIALRKELRDEAMKLVRLRITNMNPSKADLHGEIFTVANEVVGIVKKFIPYGEVTDGGFHVPNILYKQLKSRKFLQVKTRKNPLNPNQDIVEQRWVPEFALEVLPQLTREELDELAKIQSASGSIG